MYLSRSRLGFKIISILLIIAAIVTLIPKNLTAHGFDDSAALNLGSRDTITSEDAEQYSIVSRDKASEIDLNSLVFNTKNGEKAEFFYPYDVKYIDDEGLVHDKDTTISKTENGFESNGTGINIFFPDKLFEGVSITSSDNKYNVSFSPLNSVDSYSAGYLADDNSIVRYVGLKTSFEYGATFMGVKENVVLNEYSGISSWSFRLMTNGLTLHERGGQYVLTDGESSVMFFGSVIAFTADDRNNTFGEMTVETISESEEYILTISVPKDWLISENTTYPVTIGPSITVNYASGTSAIQDEILSSTGTYSVHYDVLYIGKGNNNEKLRGVMCFPELDLSGKYITSASLEIRDVMCESTPTLVEMYEYTGGAWTENTTLTWSNASSYGDLLDSHYVKCGNGNTGSDSQRYAFDITALAQKWAAGYASPSQGVLIKTTDAFENASGFFHRCFASKDYGNNTHKPSLVITYANPKGLNPSYSYDTRTLGGNVTVYNYHNFGNILLTYDFDTKTKGFPLPLFFAYNSADDSWRLSIDESVTADAGRYKYTDGYGTEYYFSYKEAGIYENAALKCEIFVTTTAITMETEDGIKKTFDPVTSNISALEYDKDIYTYTYGTYGIARIDKNDDVLFEFEHSVHGLTSAFGYTFGYSGILLNSITDKYGNTTSFTRNYIAMIILTSIDVQSSLTTDGIQMTFDLNTRRVTGIVTYRGSVSNDISNDLYTYDTGWTSTSSTFADLDADDLQNTVTTYIFDMNGRTVNEYVQAAGSASPCLSASDYRTDDTYTGNIIGSGGTNMISDSSFETSAWSGSYSYACDDALLGAKVMKVYTLISPSMPISPPVGTYTFSAYVKGENAKASLLLANMTGATAAQSEVFPLDDNWVRIYLSFEITSFSIWFLKVVNSGTEPLYVDCVQLEQSDTPTTYNILGNSGFDSSAAGWSGGSYSTVETIFGPTVSIDAGSAVSQTVTLGGVSEDNSFTVSGWLLPGIRQTKAGIMLTFNGTNTTSVSVPFEGFCYGTPSFCCAQVLPPEGTGDITSVTFSVVNNSETAAVYVDDLLLSFGSIERMPDDDGTSQGLEFSSNYDGTCSLTGIGNCTDTDIVIPDRSPVGDLVTAIANNAFLDNDDIISVIGGSNIESIGDNAFRNCVNLKSVSFGEGLKRIRYNAFQDCVNLETVQLPDSLLRIDNVAFGNCEKLKTFIIPENVNILGTYVFYECEDLEKVTVPISVTSIPNYTFANINGNVKIYYAGTSSRWALVTKGTNALPSSYTLFCNSEVRGSNVYTYTFTNGIKSSVTVTSLDDYSQVESYIYDADGNITEYTDSNSNTTIFEYDLNGNLTAIVAPGGRETEYTYNSTGDVITETDANGNTATYTYYPNGLLYTQSKGGTMITYAYNGGLVASVTVSGSGYFNLYFYSYNNYGNLTSVQMGMMMQSVVSYTYTCGGRGRLASKTESNGYCETYKYDGVGNLVETAVSGSTVYKYTYDLSGRLLVKNDASLNISEITLLTPDGGAITYTFGSSVNVIKTVKEDGTILFSDGSAYTSLPESISSDGIYDNLNRETAFALKLTQNETETDIFTITRTYLDNNSYYAPEEVVTEEFSNAGSFKYVYDSCGNLTEVRDGNTNTILLKYTYDAKNQLIREDNSFATASYTWEYDANGNIKRKTVYPFNTGTLGTATSSTLYSYSGDKLTSYGGTAISYSGLNPTNWRNASSLTWRGRELLSITNDTSTTTFEYNADGLRTKKTHGSSVTEYIWDGDKLIQEINPDRTLTFLYDGGEIAGFSTEGSNYYYAKDSFGVILYVYNEDGSIYASYKYDSWGKLIESASSLPQEGDINPIRYKSYYYDAETEFYYLQSRYYDPVVGRFLNADDAAYLGVSGTVLGWNLFAYCENSPLIYFDKNGLSLAATAGSFMIAALADALGYLMAGISTSVAGLKTALSTAWLPWVCLASAAIAVTGIIVTVSIVKHLHAIGNSVVAKATAEALRRARDQLDHSGYSVYVIMKRTNSKIVYVGMTGNFSKRRYQHQLKPNAKYPVNTFNMIILATGLTKNQARIMEQTLLTSFSLVNLNNLINSIARGKWNSFRDDFSDVLGMIQSWVDPE